MKKPSSAKRPSLALLRAAALEGAFASGKVLKKHFGRKLVVREKKRAGLVTNADVEAERAAMRALSKRFPDFGFLSEEEAPEGMGSLEGRWVIDPLDGTTNFVHRFPMFCVSVAAEWRGEILVGVIHHPILDQTWVAVRGQGAFLNGKRIHVSKTRKIREALLTTGFAYQPEEELTHEIRAFERLSSVARAIRRPGSAALDLAYTACGVFDGFWEKGLSPWDVAAGSLLVEEAGGRVTDFDGRSFSILAREIVATNQALHKPLLSMI